MSDLRWCRLCRTTIDVSGMKFASERNGIEVYLANRAAHPVLSEQATKTKLKRMEPKITPVAAAPSLGEEQ